MGEGLQVFHEFKFAKDLLRDLPAHHACKPPNLFACYIRVASCCVCCLGLPSPASLDNYVAPKVPLKRDSKICLINPFKQFIIEVDVVSYGPPNEIRGRFYD